MLMSRTFRLATEDTSKTRKSKFGKVNWNSLVQKQLNLANSEPKLKNTYIGKSSKPIFVFTPKRVLFGISIMSA